MTRLLHCSDLHLLPQLGAVPTREWISKRAAGALNYWKERRHQFASTPRKIAGLAECARQQQVDAVLCTGDYTLWGTEHELRTARPASRALIEAAEVFVTVPGNHDIYTQRVVDEQRFERHFGDLLVTDRPESIADGQWPLVRSVGDDVVVIAVNSAVPHWEPWKASGRISAPQMVALRRLLTDPVIRRRFVFVMTHHAPRLADGRNDAAHHGLENADEFVEACSTIDRGAVLFGHVHHSYRLDVPGMSAPLFCCGSSTLTGREGIWLFDVVSDRASVRRGTWGPDGYVLDEPQPLGS